MNIRGKPRAWRLWSWSALGILAAGGPGCALDRAGKDLIRGNFPARAEAYLMAQEPL